MSNDLDKFFAINSSLHCMQRAFYKGVACVLASMVFAQSTAKTLDNADYKGKRGWGGAKNRRLPRHKLSRIKNFSVF